MPDSGNVYIVPSEASVTVNVPVFGPMLVGLKVTDRLQNAFGNRNVQFPVLEKSVLATVLMLSVWNPVLCNVTFLASTLVLLMP